MKRKEKKKEKEVAERCWRCGTGVEHAHRPAFNLQHGGGGKKEKLKKKKREREWDKHMLTPCLLPCDILHSVWILPAKRSSLDVGFHPS
jgi:hypothetical protein